MKNKPLPKVSFIIPTLNASYFLKKSLPAIRNQKYPQSKVEIIISDGGSVDNTLKIAKKYKARVINNPEVLHEPGKARASKIATGDILFFTDSDNVPAHKNWLQQMVEPFMKEKNIVGFLPQTVAPPDSPTLNRYLGHLFTDPFTWFVYGNAANPIDYEKIYKPLKKTNEYIIYKFPIFKPPLFGLSQGVGTTRSFKREKMGRNDDLLSGIKMIQEGGLIAYVPSAHIYHYHVSGFSDFIRKYRWRIRNNFLQQVRGMGFINREKYFNTPMRIRKLLFVPYGTTIVFPFIDGIKLSMQHKDFVMMLHCLVSFILSILIVHETVAYKLGITKKLSTAYGK